VVFVAKGSASEHDDCGCDVRGSNEALGFSDGEAHSETEDDGEEVGDGVGVCCREAEEAGESPDFGVEGVLEVGFQGERF